MSPLKSACIAAKKLSDKYKKMRFKKPTLLVDRADLETIDYNDEPNEDIFANESVLAAANKVFAFEKYQKEQASKIDEFKQQQIDDKLLLMKAFFRRRTKFLILTDIKGASLHPRSIQ